MLEIAGRIYNSKGGGPREGDVSRHSIVYELDDDFSIALGGRLKGQLEKFHEAIATGGTISEELKREVFMLLKQLSALGVPIGEIVSFL